jgi:GNAT superfamily N-acetyltransferase
MTIIDKSFDEKLSFQVIEMDEILRNSDLMKITRDLTLGAYSSSGMNLALDSYIEKMDERSINAKGIYANLNDTKIGWALLTQESDGFYFSPKEGHACIQIFVEWQYRRHGVGTKLIKMATELAKDKILGVYSHNNPSFFSQWVVQPNFTSL